MLTLHLKNHVQREDGIMLAETMLADLRARAAGVCYCWRKRTGCTRGPEHRGSFCRKRVRITTTNVWPLGDATRREGWLINHLCFQACPEQNMAAAVIFHSPP